MLVNFFSKFSIPDFICKKQKVVVSFNETVEIFSETGRRTTRNVEHNQSIDFHCSIWYENENENNIPEPQTNKLDVSFNGSAGSFYERIDYTLDPSEYVIEHNPLAYENDIEMQNPDEIYEVSDDPVIRMYQKALEHSQAALKESQATLVLCRATIDQSKRAIEAMQAIFQPRQLEDHLKPINRELFQVEEEKSWNSSQFSLTSLISQSLDDAGSHHEQDIVDQVFSEEDIEFDDRSFCSLDFLPRSPSPDYYPSIKSRLSIVPDYFINHSSDSLVESIGSTIDWADVGLNIPETSTPVSSYKPVNSCNESYRKFIRSNFELSFTSKEKISRSAVSLKSSLFSVFVPFAVSCYHDSYDDGSSSRTSFHFSEGSLEGEQKRFNGQKI